MVWGSTPQPVATLIRRIRLWIKDLKRKQEKSFVNICNFNVADIVLIIRRVKDLILAKKNIKNMESELRRPGTRLLIDVYRKVSASNAALSAINIGVW